MELSDDELLQWKPRMGLLTVAEKIEQAETIKKQANVYFKRGEIKKALPAYAKGDAMEQYAGKTANMSATPDEGDQIRDLKIAVWSNMAFCYVKLGTKPEKAIEYCEHVLAEDDTHSKALFRKAQALVQLKHFDRAQTILTKLATAEPKNGAVRSELRNLLQQKKQYDDEAKTREKSAFGNMFNKKK